MTEPPNHTSATTCPSAADLIRRGESLTVEFKSDRKCLPDRELVEALAAMANSQGGAVLLGVEDDRSVTGLHKAHADAETGIPPLVESRTDPPLAVSVERVEIDGKDVAVVRVRKSPRLVGTTDGKYLRRRIGPDGRPQVVAVRPADVVSFQSSLGLLDPSALVLEGVSASELDPLQRVRLRQFIERYHGDAALASLFVMASTTVTEDDEGVQRARSAAEAFLFQRLETLPETRGRFSLNVKLPIAFGKNAFLEPDLLCGELRIALEIDGVQHLGSTEAYRRDRRKDMLLQENGYFVMRFLYDDVLSNLDYVLGAVLWEVRRRQSVL